MSLLFHIIEQCRNTHSQKQSRPSSQVLRYGKGVTMLSVREEILPYGCYSQEITFACPKCGEEEDFYVWPPEVCNCCGEPVEELLLMHTEEREDPKEALTKRIEYYREGEL